jgi:glucose-1-phosphate cytidylyltransferase
MKVIILAGGFGTRLSEYTSVIPKPMVTVGSKPILWHLMKIYAHFNHKDFYLALGYKAEVIKQFFLNYKALNSDFSINSDSGKISFAKDPSIDNIDDWRVTLVDTGDKSMTGGRVKRLESFIGKETCLLTYGDGLSDIDLDELLSFHKSHGRLVTVTAVRPSARFGELNLDKSYKVKSFKEKPQIDKGWINGGFFVIEPEFFKRIKGDETVLEAEPLESCAKDGELMAYKHEGFWQCMDTKRDRDTLEELWNLKNPPWKY